LDISTCHQVFDSDHCGQKLNAVAPARRPHFVLQFTDFAFHFGCITVAPNTGADQTFTTLGATICFVNVHGVILFHCWLLFAVYVCIIAKGPFWVNQKKNPANCRVFGVVFLQQKY
jgi:hypothetical protein